MYSSSSRRHQQHQKKHQQHPKKHQLQTQQQQKCRKYMVLGV